MCIFRRFYGEQPDGQNEGFCQQYRGAACSKYLENKSIYVTSKFQQGLMEERLTGWYIQRLNCIFLKIRNYYRNEKMCPPAKLFKMLFVPKPSKSAYIVNRGYANFRKMVLAENGYPSIPLGIRLLQPLL